MRFNLSQLVKNLEGNINAIYINDESLAELLSKVKIKVEENKHLNRFWEEIKIFSELLKDWASGDYKNISKNNIMIITAGLLYIINPFDLLPDLLPGGILDDLIVLGFVIKKTSEEIKKYKEWKGLVDGDESLSIYISHMDEEEEV